MEHREVEHGEGKQQPGPVRRGECLQEPDESQGGDGEVEETGVAFSLIPVLRGVS